MPVFWRPQLKVGNDDIDNDHRYLILLINTVELVIRFPESPDNIETALNELHHYAEAHFKREEQIQIAWGYRNLDQHKLEHRKLMEGLESLMSRVKQTLSNPETGRDVIEAESGEITDFLRKWLIQHVIKSDLLMKDLFKKPQIT